VNISRPKLRSEKIDNNNNNNKEGKNIRMRNEGGGRWNEAVD